MSVAADPQGAGLRAWLRSPSPASTWQARA